MKQDDSAPGGPGADPAGASRAKPRLREGEVRIPKLKSNEAPKIVSAGGVDAARSYIAPVSLPKGRDHATFEMQTIKVDPRLDPTKRPTIISARRPSALEPQVTDDIVDDPDAPPVPPPAAAAPAPAAPPAAPFQPVGDARFPAAPPLGESPGLLTLARDGAASGLIPQAWKPAEAEAPSKVRTVGGHTARIDIGVPPPEPTPMAMEAPLLMGVVKKMLPEAADGPPPPSGRSSNRRTARMELHPGPIPEQEALLPALEPTPLPEPAALSPERPAEAEGGVSGIAALASPREAPAQAAPEPSAPAAVTRVTDPGGMLAPAAQAAPRAPEALVEAAPLEAGLSAAPPANDDAPESKWTTEPGPALLSDAPLPSSFSPVTPRPSKVAPEEAPDSSRRKGTPWVPILALTGCLLLGVLGFFFFRSPPSAGGPIPTGPLPPDPIEQAAPPPPPPPITEATTAAPEPAAAVPVIPPTPPSAAPGRTAEGRLSPQQRTVIAPTAPPTSSAVVAPPPSAAPTPTLKMIYNYPQQH